jgi:hypothetical protein
MLQAGRLRVRFPTNSKDFTIEKSFLPHYGPRVDLACNRNEYQGTSSVVKGGRGYAKASYGVCKIEKINIS